MKKYFKTSLIIVSIAFMFLFAGCQFDTSAQRLATLQSAITAAQQASSEADGQIVLLQTSIAEFQTLLADANMPADFRLQASEALAKAQVKLQYFLDIKAKADKAMADYQKTMDNIAAADANKLDWSDEAKAWGGIITTTAPLAGPAAGWLYIIGSAVTVIGSIGAALKKASDEKKAKEKEQQASKALDEVVTGNEIYLQSAQATDVARFKEAQNRVQTAETVQKVAAIKAS